MVEENERQRLLSEVLAARGALLAGRWLPRSKPVRLALAGLVLVGLVGLGAVSFVRASPEARQPPALPRGVVASSSSSSAPPQQLVVSVVGKVREPGLVKVADGARVADAIAAAGGARTAVDLSKVNLARRVGDGEQLFIGIPAPQWAQPQQPAAGPSAPAGNAGQGAKVNLNTANAEQLDTLAGVGEVTAKRILEWRTEHGRFDDIAQLKDVSGIGDAKFDKLKDSVTVR